MTSAEVEAVLGSPDLKRLSRLHHLYLTSRPGLAVAFTGGKVTKTARTL